MTADIKKATDDELRTLIEGAQKELKERAETRRLAAIEEIKRIAAAQNLHINFNGKSKKPLQAGLRYANPEQPDQVYETGKGRPPGWFEKLRKRGKLPEPLKAGAA